MTVTISSKTDVSCNGLTDGTATATVGGGTLPYDYSWSNGQTTLNTINNTNSVSNLPAGLISITITDGNGCTATANETILEPTPVSASIGIPTMVTCNGDAMVLPLRVLAEQLQGIIHICGTMAKLLLQLQICTWNLQCDC